ncbi:MAG: hypothetical protein ACXWUH_18595 [Burkholderiales bacterium]
MEPTTISAPAIFAVAVSRIPAASLCAGPLIVERADVRDALLTAGDFDDFGDVPRDALEGGFGRAIELLPF